MKKSNKPCMNCGGSYMQQGGYTNPKGMFWDGKKWVKSKGATYASGNFYKEGGPAYTPVMQHPNYWKTYDLWEDGGNITELQTGGYVPAPITAKPQILQQTNGTYHMAMGGYMPAPITAKPNILPMTNGVHHLQYGGPAASGNHMYNVYSAKPALPIEQDGGYWHPYGLIEDGGHIAEAKKGGHWIQKAVNPAHKGYCTPMTKSTCTPRRKALAMTFKKHHGFHQEGGPVDMYANGGMFGPGNYDPNQETEIPTSTVPPNQSSTYTDPAATGVVAPTPDPADTAMWRQGMTDEQANDMLQNPSNYPDPNQAPAKQKNYRGAKIAGAIAGATTGLAALGKFAGYQGGLKEGAKYARNMGMSTNMPMVQGSHGDYNQQGYYHPGMNIPTMAGNYLPGGRKYGGAVQYKNGGVYDLDEKEIKKLVAKGYKVQYL